MPLPRLLTLIAAFCLALGLIIGLVSSLTGLYSQVAWSASPLLANLLIFLIIVLLGTLIFALFYYFRLLQRPQKVKGKRPINPKVPVVKSEAASENLKAIRQQVDRIQDEVARQALLLRAREIEASMARGSVRVVVFGTGSAGKTSAVNALVGRMAGQVGAPMGTTEVGETYTLKLKGIDRELAITDTPGILEAGVAGTYREELARQLAARADLILFVLDGDLRKSEYEPLRTLAEIGKRSIVVFNKVDLYPDTDRDEILDRLRQRVKGFVSAMDVVAISANPQKVVLEDGTIFQPDPDIMPLIRRVAAILRAEGEDLIADNILLQSQHLGDQARKLIDAQRRRQADKAVERFQWIGAGVIAVTPLPVVDLLATAAVNAQMVVEIAKIYGCELNIDRAKELALSLAKTLASLGIVEGVIQVVSRALQLSVAGFVLGKAIQAVSAAYLTRIAGKSFIEYFRHDQDWGDGGITEVVQRQFQLNRKDEFVKAFVKDAIARVVEPLNIYQQESEPELEMSAELEPEPLYQSPQHDDWETHTNKRNDEW
ncbi:GTP-binding protein [Microcoleus sp. MOSTC5]|uniref:tRNA modification GTPase MnmE n=1 Tax=Microcoleus asticus IPMA8 TaxID=2563858 RepID=A0ABX2CU65_9CYAN|nr:GTP-binding protein [Microcoleus asticus]NQE33939.1 tRNA modification GTPase MnmE [Microcoleus asticus IPMA8]